MSVIIQPSYRARKTSVLFEERAALVRSTDRLSGCPLMMNSHSKTTEFIEMASPQGPRLVQLPGLDGLRGVAVAAVVLYHMGFGWATGGYLGVSTFFTLSGFLITSILLNESVRAGRPSFRRFWSRRFRRLMPAAMTTLVAIAVIFGRTVATADQRLAIRGDVLSSLFYVANWRFILNGSKYGDLTASPSPVLHFWSLSIEEQFYVFFPLALFGIWRLARGRRRVLGASLAALCALSAALPWIFSMSVNRSYMGSDVRAAEILAGGVLAVVLSNGSVRRAVVLRYQIRIPLLALATVCAAGQIFCFVAVQQPSGWLYRGGLLAFAAATCVIITAAAIPVGPFSAVLSSGPLRWFGTRSYGIYLLHWPLLVGARQLFPSSSNVIRGSLAVALAMVLAEMSFRYLETPVRLGHWPSSRGVARTALASFVVVAVVASLPIPVNRRELGTDFDRAAAQLRTLNSGVSPTTTRQGGSTETTAPTSTVPTPPTAPKVSFFGDSTAVLAALGLATSVKFGTTTTLSYSGGETEVGCGVSRFARNRLVYEGPLEEKCLRWPQVWANSVQEIRPDIAMILTGPWEIVDFRLPNSSEWTHIGNPSADDFIRSELNEAVSVTSSQGALTILWLWPPFAPWADDQGRPSVIRQHDPARMERLHALMREVAEANPDKVRVFDLGEYLGPTRLGDRSVRPDGLHIPSEMMTELFASGLSERIYDIYAEWWHTLPH